MLILADKPPERQTTLVDRDLAWKVWHRIALLGAVPCCGMCGTTRHQTKAYWTLGMRVCRQCMQANLISCRVLYERYWITFSRVVQDGQTFVDRIHLNAFYFRTRTTPNQRLEYSTDKLDFPGGTRNVWFFWKPHLNKILDMDRLEREGQAKHEAAKVLRAFARRATVLRTLAGHRRGHRVHLHSFHRRRDMRTVEGNLRKLLLLDHVDHLEAERIRLKMTKEELSRLYRGEERMIPLFIC